MSFREKTHWVALIVILAAFGFYFVQLHTVMPRGPGHMAASGALLMAISIGIILAMSIVIGIVAALNPREAHQKGDERDRLIHWRGTHVAYYPIVVGVWACIGAIYSGLSVESTLHSLLAVVVIAEVVRIGSQLWLYRRT